MDKQESIVKWMSLIAILEGLSYLFILFIGMPLKYGLDIPTPNYIGGMLHGLLFMLYIGLIYPTGKNLNWDFITILLAVVASVIPFGTFWFDKKYLKE